MSWRRILFLLVLVAALGTYLYVYEIPQAREESTKKKLLGVDKDAIVGLDLVYPDREIELKKGDKGWRLTKPVDAPADDASVKALVNTLADAEVQKTLDEAPADPAAFGLEKPNPRVTVTVSSGTAPPPIAVGKNTAIGGKTYVRKGDEPKVYLTTSSLNYGLNKQAKDLRDKQLLAFQDDDVQRVDIAADGTGTTSLLRKDKDAWTVQPGDKPADPTEVRSYLSTLRTTRATDFPDDAPADLGKYGLDHPRLSVTVGTGKDGAETQTLLLGAEGTQGTQKVVYAKRATQPTVYGVGEWTMRSLGKQAGDFRDKTVLAFDQSRVGRVVIDRKSGGATTLVRGADGKWTVEGAGDKKPNDVAVSRYVDDAHDLRGASIAAEPPGDLHRFGLDAPDVRVTLSDKDGQPIGTLLGAKHDAKYYVMKANGETVYEARDYMYGRLDKPPQDFVATDQKPVPQAANPATTPPPDAAPDEPEGEEPEEGD